MDVSRPQSNNRQQKLLKGTTGVVEINQMIDLIRQFISDANFLNTVVARKMTTDVGGKATGHQGVLSHLNSAVPTLNGRINALHTRFGLDVPPAYVGNPTGDTAQQSGNSANNGVSPNTSLTG